MSLEKLLINSIKKLPGFRGVFSELDYLRTLFNPLEFPPGHYSSPHPSIEDIRNREAEIFGRTPPGIPAVDLNEGQQMALLRDFTAFYREQPFGSRKRDGLRYFFENPAYGSHDAIILYCFLRKALPKRVIEIGSGYSSCVILDTNELFLENRISCTLIEPHPQLLESLTTEEDRSRVRVIQERVQDLGLNLFQSLEADDILLVDSSHVAKVDSDVNFIFFEVLPQLRSGVYVHFHDVRFPFEYWKEWIYAGRAWNEAYLLRAFLQYNNAFKIQYFCSFLAEFHRNELAQAMPDCMKDTGGSLWLKKVADSEQVSGIC